MNHSEPFHWLMGFSIVGTLFSFVEMNEALRFVILLGTSIGVLVKTWEQIRNSKKFIEDMKIIWINTRKNIRNIRGK
jgi:hypothetical protein